MSDKTSPEGDAKPDLSSGVGAGSRHVDALPMETDNGVSYRYTVDRPVCSQKELDQRYQKTTNTATTSHLKARLKQKCHPRNLARSLFNSFPVLTWLPKYQWKSDLLRDALAGLTIGVMHIPQGMAYALLTELPPIYGLYVSFLSGLIYSIMGTSKHISVGPTAFIALMVGESINKIVDIDALTMQSSGVNGTEAVTTMNEAALAEILSAVTCVSFIAGVTQIIMSVLHLGFLTNYLSNTFISGYTSGVAVHVLSSQMKSAFGMRLPRFSGPLSLVYMYKELISNLHQTNLATLLLFTVAVVIINVVKFLNQKFKKHLKIPLPTELIIVVVGTMVCYFAKLDELYNIDYIGDIPKGLPPTSIPGLSNALTVLGDGVAVGFVSFSIAISMGKLFAKKHRYKVNPNQELLSLGLCNLVASFFSGYAGSTSMSRSSVQDSVGGRTQMTDFICSLLLLVVLMAIAPIFQTLPKAVLAAIIMTALTPIFIQALELKTLWRRSQYECVVWVITWISVVLLGVDLGLFIGVGFSLLTVVCKIQAPHSLTLEHIPDTELYRKKNSYSNMAPVDGVLVFRMSMSLFYINADLFQSRLRKSFDEQRWCPVTTANGTAEGATSDRAKELAVVARTNGLEVTLALDRENPIRFIIVDCQGFNFIDLKGVDCLNQVIFDYLEKNVEILLAGCRENVMDLLNKADFLEKHGDRLFISVHDAVLYAKHKLTTESPPDVSILEEETNA